MLSRRQMFLRASALAGAAAVSSLPLAPAAYGREGDAKVGVDVVAWLKANALPLATTEPGSSFHDLEPFRARLAKARIVGLGETTHGTREFFQLKHRVIKYCVSQLGFTIIAFEADYGSTLAVNDYVVDGKGNFDDAVLGLGFPIWDTEEVHALVKWVRNWNLSHERKVKFHGLDMQSSAAAALHVLAYLERVAPALAAASERTLAPLISHFTFDRFDDLPTSVQDAVCAQIRTLLDAFAAERAGWIGRSSDMDWHLARQSAVLLDRFARFMQHLPGASMADAFAVRDGAMADAARALLEAEGPGSKALLWAHNGHVKKSKGYDFAWGTFDWPIMGNYLQSALGPEYVAVGFAFNQGGYQAWGDPMGDNLESFRVGPAPEGSVDAVLALTGIPLLALDLARVPADGPVASWMASRPYQRMIGSGNRPPNENRINYRGDPRNNFDVLLFVESANAARGVKRPGPGNTEPAANTEPTNLALKARDLVPDGWRAMAHHHFRGVGYPYVAAAADETSPQGGRTVRITRQPSLLAWGDGAMGQSFPAAPWHGQRLTFSAALRAEAPRIGTGAQVIVMVWPKEKDARPIMAVQAEGLVRSSGWVRRSVTIDVPAEAERVEINLVVTGNAAGWFGDLELTPAGVAGVADGRHDFPKMPVGVHHRERVGDFIEWERLLPDRLWAE